MGTINTVGEFGPHGAVIEPPKSSIDSGGGFHPPLSRLLAWYHRTLGEEELPRLLGHLRRCEECQSRATKISAVVSSFESTPSWRRDCPPATELFSHASHELEGDKAKEVQDHVMMCFTCREELLVFRDLRQSVRIGRSAFLNPANWLLWLAYWRTRGFLALLASPQYGKLLTWSLKALGAVVVLAVGFGLYSLDWDSAPTKKDGRMTVSNAEDATPRPDPATLKVQELPRTLYFFQYVGTDVLFLPPGHPATQWASFQIENEAAGAEGFKVLQPPGQEGMIVIRPGSALTGPQLSALETQVRSALGGSARQELRAWVDARAGLQDLSRGAVYLLNAPPKEGFQGRMAGPSTGFSGGVPAREERRGP